MCDTSLLLITITDAGRPHVKRDCFVGMGYRLLPLATAGAILLAAGLAFGQEPTAPPRAAGESPTTPAPAAPAAPAAGSAIPADADALDTYLLRDANGKLVPVVGLKYEDFKALMDLKLNLAAPAPPGYTLEMLAITGTAIKERATLQVQVTIRTRDAGWVRVPLRMHSAVLRDPPKYQGAGEQFTTCDPTGDGYVCWLKGGEAKPHNITFSIAAPLTEAGSERRLALSLPRATESSLRLEVSLARVEASLKNGSEGILSTKTLGAAKSEIAVLGAAGDLQLAWLPLRDVPTQGPALLESSGDIAVKVESKTRISSDARLRVRSLGGPFSSFQVRLPPGMELVPTTPVGYSVTPLQPPMPPAKASSGKPAPAQTPPQTIEIKLDRPTSSVVEVRLLAALSPDTQPTGKNIEPGNFQVVGAVRQRGTIDFSVDGDWSLQWGGDESVRRIDLPTDAAAKTVARFEFFRQPCQLKLLVASRPTRISVEPTYRVQVDSRQVRLEATLKYRLRGARTSAISLAPGDWKFDRVTPDGLVDFDGVVPSDGTPLVLPLQDGAAQLGEFEIKLEAHRDIPEGSSSLLFSFPRPVADVVTPASVVIVAADNVELTPNNAELRGLTPDVSPPPSRATAVRQQQPLAYRDLGAGEPAVFSSGFQIRARRTSVQAESQIALDKQRIQVEQHLQYQIAYEPQRAFEVLIPGELPPGIDVRVLLGTQSLPLTALVADAGTFNAVGRRMRFEAPGDQIGPCEFVVKYSLPMPRINRSSPATVVVPLVIPADEPNQELGGHVIVATFTDDLRAETAAERLETPARLPDNIVATEQDGVQTLRVSLPTMTPKSEWKINSVEPGRLGATNVLKAWVQTWLTSRTREDRAVWRFTTSQESLRIRLPSGSNLDDVQIALNGQALEGVIREGADLKISLPADSAGEEQVLEAWYSAPKPRSGWGFVVNQLEAPSLTGAGSPRRMYWQLCVPQTEHLLQEPGDFAAELAWRWRGYYWDRQAVLDQSRLEDWIGASRQEPVPEAVNQYLFSSFSRVAPLRAVTAGRRFLLFIASCGVLGLGLLLLHVRAARRPSLLLAGAVLLAAGVLLSPGTALLLGEAAAIGMLLAVVAGVWSWLASGRTLWPTPAPSTVIPAPAEPKSSRVSPPRVERAAPASTAPGQVDVVASESHV